LDLEEGHIGKLIADLGGSGAEVAVASLWAQSMMDEAYADWLSLRGASWVRSRLPVSVMSEKEVDQVLEGMTEGADRCRTIAEAGAIPPLVGLLGSARGREAEFAAGALCGLAEDGRNLKAMANAGAVGPLVRLLSCRKGAEAENAAGALWGLCGRYEFQRFIAEAGAIPLLINLLSSGKGAEAENAAGALWNLADRAEIQELMADAGAIPSLVKLLSSVKGAEAENAAGALGKLAQRAENQELIAEAGGVRLLVRLLSFRKGAEAENAAGALMRLANQSDHRGEMVEDGAIEPLVKLLSSPRGDQASNAAGAIWHICLAAENREIVAEAGAIGPLVKLSSSWKKAEALRARSALHLLLRHPGNWPHIVTTPAAIPGLVRCALDQPSLGFAELLDQLCELPLLVRTFHQSLLRTRTLLASWKDMDAAQLDLLGRWYPALADEIRGYESFDEWRVHVERCDLRRLLLSWRRGVVDVENAARDQWRASESAAKRVKVAVVAELPPITTNNSSDSGEVAAASGRVLR
jgi:hypothetical protein